MTAAPLPVPKVRPATLDDVETIVRFNQAMARETEGRQLDVETLRRGARVLLEAPGRGRYLLAERGGETVGQLMLTFEWSDWRAGTFWWVQSVYVVESARRTGVYRALYAHALKRAREAGDVCGVRLYVERDNLGAQQTYRALGMAPTDYVMFETETLALPEA